MKLRRKLVPALALLLVSVMMMSTTTYAWFSMNATATATGMQISAKTAESLLICDTSDGTYVAEKDFSTTAKKAKVAPVSAVDLTSATTVNAAIGAGTSAILGKARTPNTEGLNFLLLDTTSNAVTNPANYAATVSPKKIVDEYTGLIAGYYTVDDGSNFVTDELYLKYEGEKGTVTPTCTIKITPASGQKPIDKALHIGFLTNKTAFEAVDACTTWNDDSVDHSTPHYEATLPVPEMTKGEAMQIDFFIWYEGEDTDCTTSNAALNDLPVVFEFTLPDESDGG